jgi:predicted transcriptional regulator
MINRAISENLIKKDIILVEDIMEDSPCYLEITDTVEKWKKIMQQVKHERYPIVDSDKKVVGIVSLKDLSNHHTDSDPVSKVMHKDPITVTPKTTVAYAAHIMGWEGIELFPVVKGKKLKGVITRRDVIKALQYMARQPQAGETLEDSILKEFEFNIEDDVAHFTGKITPEMLDPIGTASWSTLNMLLSTMAIMILRQKNKANILVDSINTYFMNPVQMDSDINIYVNIIDEGINYCKVEVDMFDGKKDIVGKCILSARMIRR